jgi:tetratricopeptide (TPR) repeat protein
VLKQILLTTYLTAQILLFCPGAMCHAGDIIEDEHYGDPKVEAMIKAGESKESAGDFAAAESYFKQAEASYNKLPKRDIHQLADILWVLEKLYEKQKNYLQATNYAVRIINVEKNLNGKDSILIAEDYKQLAHLEFLMDKYEQAKTNDLTAIKIALPAWPGDYCRAVIAARDNCFRKYQLLADCYANAAECAARLGKTEEGIRIYNTGLQECSKLDSIDLPKEVAEDLVLKEYSDFLKRNNKTEEAQGVDKRREGISGVAGAALAAPN